eukprot:6475138-Amphidinium_carterae.2
MATRSSASPCQTELLSSRLSLMRAVAIQSRTNLQGRTESTRAEHWQEKWDTLVQNLDECHEAGKD